MDGAYTSDGTMEQQQHGCSSLAWVQLVVVLEANKMVLSMDKRMDKRITSAMVSPFVAWIHGPPRRDSQETADPRCRAEVAADGDGEGRRHTF